MFFYVTMKDKDFCSHAECIDGDNDDDFNMNSEENIASLDPHLSEDEIDEAEPVKTYMHFIQVSCFYTCFPFFFLFFSPFTWRAACIVPFFLCKAG